jgi:hypothetical protein
MGAHIVNGQFQSDKYPTCPPGKVPLSVKDKDAQGLLWAYAQRRRSIDAEFSDDLETALRAAGYSPPVLNQSFDVTEGHGSVKALREALAEAIAHIEEAGCVDGPELTLEHWRAVIERTAP